MKYLLTVFAVLTAIYAIAQPPEQEVLRLLDTYELIPGGQQPAASTMYPGEGLSLIEGSFILTGRKEYVAMVPLVKGPKRSDFAYVCFQDADGDWQRSNWYVLGYLSLERANPDGDGRHELIQLVEYVGRRMTKTSWQLLSLAGDKEKELFKTEGFELSETAIQAAQAGDETAVAYKIEQKDLDKDGISEILEHLRTSTYVDMPEGDGHKIEVEEKTRYYRLEDGAYQRYVPKEKQKAAGE